MTSEPAGASWRTDDKGRKYEDESNDGEDHAGDGTDGKIEPENLLGTVGKERQETEDSR